MLCSTVSAFTIIGSPTPRLRRSRLSSSTTRGLIWRSLTGPSARKYRQIANRLRAAVRAGEYEPGDRLPGENDLMATYGVARMTARQAIGVLTTEGVAEARKGSGVYARDFTPVIRSALTRLSHERWSAGASIWSANADGRDITVSTTVTEIPVPERIAPLLALEDDQLVCVRARRFVLDDKPVQLSTSYLPSSIVAGSPIAQEDTGPGGTYARLAELGHAPAHFREERPRPNAPARGERSARPPGRPTSTSSAPPTPTTAPRRGRDDPGGPPTSSATTSMVLVAGEVPRRAIRQGPSVHGMHSRGSARFLS